MPDRQPLPPGPEAYATDAEILEDAAYLPTAAQLLRDRHATACIVLRYGQPHPWRLVADLGGDALRGRRLAELIPDRPLSGGEGK